MTSGGRTAAAASGALASLAGMFAPLLRGFHWSSETSWYSSLVLLATLAATLKNLLYAGLLPVQAFGVYTLAILITGIGGYASTLGVADGLFREVPIRRGRGAGPELTRLRSGAVTASGLLGILAGLVVSAACLSPLLQRADLRGLAWAGPMLAATVLFNVLLLDLRARERSVPYGSLLLARSAGAIVAVIPLVHLLGSAGVFVADIASLLLCAVIGWRRFSPELRPTCRPLAEVVAVARVGLPFAGATGLQTLAMSADRWAVQIGLGTAALARYSFGMFLGAIGLVVLNAIQQYAAPRILTAYGRTRDTAVVRQRVARLAAVVTAGAAIGAVPAVLGFAWMVGRWYPQYAAVAGLAPFFYAGAALTALGFYDILFYAHGNGRGLLLVQAAVLTALGAAYVVTVVTHAPLLVYAVLFVGGRLAALLTGFGIGLRLLSHARREPANPGLVA